MMQEERSVSEPPQLPLATPPIRSARAFRFLPLSRTEPVLPPRQRLLQALGKRERRTESDLVAQACDVGNENWHVVVARRQCAEPKQVRLPGPPRELADRLRNRDRLPAADVDRPAHAAGQYSNEGAGHILDMHEVSNLPPVGAKRGTPLQQRPRGRRDQAAFGLARAVQQENATPGVAQAEPRRTGL